MTWHGTQCDTMWHMQHNMTWHTAQHSNNPSVWDRQHGHHTHMLACILHVAYFLVIVCTASRIEQINYFFLCFLSGWLVNNQLWPVSNLLRPSPKRSRWCALSVELSKSKGVCSGRPSCRVTWWQHLSILEVIRVREVRQTAWGSGDSQVEGETVVGRTSDQRLGIGTEDQA
jgi:hypothetical protein